MHVVAGVAVIKTGGHNKVDGILAHVAAIPVGCLGGILFIPLVVFVPPFARVPCQLSRLNTVYHKQHVDLGKTVEGVSVVVVALGGHSGTGIVCGDVGGQAVPIIDGGRAALAVIVHRDAGVRRYLGALFDLDRRCSH